VIKTVPESQIVETLIEEAMRLAAEMDDASELVAGTDNGPGTTASGSPIVTVS
jgi:(E)-4-hydroxy-3-methylbut-2-enyl-diphosphate synthase